MAAARPVLVPGAPARMPRRVLRAVASAWRPDPAWRRDQLRRVRRARLLAWARRAARASLRFGADVAGAVAVVILVAQALFLLERDGLFATGSVSLGVLLMALGALGAALLLFLIFRGLRSMAADFDAHLIDSSGRRLP